MVKGFNIPFEYVLYDMSYVNVVMYSATLPTYNDKEKDGEQKEQETIKADDPKNRDKVAKFFASVE